MKDSEIFDDFNVKLSDFVNNCFNLGDPIPKSKLVRKILQSPPPKFHAKAVTIEETKDLDNLRVEELVGNLQTYEANHIPTLSQKEWPLCLLSMKEDILMMHQRAIPKIKN